MPVQSKGALLAGRYRVVGPLGSGGMATVLLCEDERLGRRVAVKRLHAHSPDEVERRFAREAKVGASLNHPNLVSVYDTATDDEGVLIAMELVEGETLRTALERGSLPRERALEILRDVAAALDHAHAHGVVHRDVKPANVLLREDGVAKLVDMGIAVAADSTRITRSGTVLGSAAYMAHEQLEGREAGPAADVYALAVVAFEVLAGRKARDGKTPIELVHQVANEPPPDLSREAPGVPRAAADALRRGMAREPTERQTSAGTLVEELERGFAEPSEAEAPTRRAAFQPASPLDAIRAAPRRRARRWPALAALAAVLLLGSFVVVYALSQGGDGTKPTPARKQAAKKPAKKPTAAKPQAGGQGGAQAGAQDAAGLNDQGFALMRQGRYGEAIPLLEQAVKAFPAGSRDTTYAYALFNLGSALRHAGRAGEAIPILERRLQIPNQTDVVQRELDQARRDAGKG
jgi:serine/threonine-protein kinase